MAPFPLSTRHIHLSLFIYMYTYMCVCLSVLLACFWVEYFLVLCEHENYRHAVTTPSTKRTTTAHCPNRLGSTIVERFRAWPASNQSGASPLKT